MLAHGFGHDNSLVYGGQTGVQDLNSTSASISCETFRFPVRLTLHFLSPYHQDTTFRNVPIQ